MDPKAVKHLFDEFLKTYDAPKADKTWLSHSNTFKEFWYSKVVPKDASPLIDDDIDEVIRVLDRSGKGNTAATEAVARAMIPQNVWRIMFRQLHVDATLCDLVTSIVEETNEDRLADLITKLYEQNPDQKNRLTGPSGTAVSCILAVVDAFKNLGVVSLNDRLALMTWMGIQNEIDFEKASIGERIVRTNKIILGAFNGIPIWASARTITRFCYSDPIKTKWKTGTDAEAEKDKEQLTSAILSNSANNAVTASVKIKNYLAEFKSEAADWFQTYTGAPDHYLFFQEFFKKENLEKADWAYIQQLRQQLNCFSTMSLAAGRALGKPNHPIEHYRKSLIYLAHGSGPVTDRIRKFAEDDEYRLAYFGEAAVSELVGNLFADQFIVLNSRDSFASEFLGIDPGFKSKDKLVDKLVKFSNTIKPVSEAYIEIVGKRTDLPVNLEVDQFFSWLYEKYGAELTEADVKDVKYSSDETPLVVKDGTAGASCWWLNANPKQWDLADAEVGSRQTYTSHNEQGNKRQKYKYFQEARPGDMLIGYVTSPDREIVAILQVTKALHDSDEGERFEFKVVEKLGTPISLVTLQGIPALSSCEPLINNQGSLFRVTTDEYEIIRSLIDESNPPTIVPPSVYLKKHALASLFLSETQFDQMLGDLRDKKSVVLQGPPGVGKTYVAKRLAYTLIGLRDESRVETIQFHQSYAYEDFIQGFRPNAKGQFDLKNGIFYQFCRRAQRDSGDRAYVFIIDEINRGNLSKIFGELMMLIEVDKRGKEFAIPLAYSQTAEERFFIPENLYLIGTMNTADRSLAMVDYALRRRFRFETLQPEFQSAKFKEHLTDHGAAQSMAEKIISRLTKLNEAITADTKNLGSGYRIGHSYYCLRGSEKATEEWYRSVVESEIVPLLKEYWLDDDEKVANYKSMLLG